MDEGVLYLAPAAVKTAEGNLWPLFNASPGADEQLERFVPGFIPRHIYTTSLLPGMSKGPIIHSERNAIFYAIEGAVVAEVLDIASQSSDPMFGCGSPDRFSLTRGKGMLCLRPGIAIRFVNRSPDAMAVMLVVSDRAWAPETDDGTKFRSWDEFINGSADDR